MTEKKLGLSIPRCVAAIARGEERIENVACVLSPFPWDDGTDENKAQWEVRMILWRDSVWRNLPNAAKICRSLGESGRIRTVPLCRQPDIPAKNADGEKDTGVWVADEDAITWHNPCDPGYPNRKTAH